jgi:chorismate mutase
MTQQLQKYRKEIEELDTQIIELLGRRFHMVAEIQKIKEVEGMPPVDEDREAQLQALYENEAIQKGLDPELIQAIFEKIIRTA